MKLATYLLCFCAFLGLQCSQWGYVGSALYDVETSQRCITAGTCREGNPLILSDSRGGMYAQKAVIGGAFVYLHRKHNFPTWGMWVITGLQAAVGTANLRFEGGK